MISALVSCNLRCVVLQCSAFRQDPSSEERFHVELHFSPGAKGCDEDENAPTGSGFRPASAEVSHSGLTQSLYESQNSIRCVLQC